ncbi:BA14K family protein [Bauldia litoralis]|uniref:BA14K family protein n=1 Tax=Bauldia litoralis TaxID=665467 RepID=UPI003265062B
MLNKTRTVLGSAAIAVAFAVSPMAAPTAQAAGPGYSGDMVHLVGNKKYYKRWKGNNYRACRNCGRTYAPNWVGPAIGFGTGFFVGSLLAQPRYYAPAPRYVAPGYAPRGYASRDAYCHQKYRSYNSRTGTYTGYDGRQHYCRIP